MTEIPDDKQILAAAKQILRIYEGDVFDSTKMQGRMLLEEERI